jgi:hypothetical protein
MEARVHLPPKALRLKTYVRYYSGAIVHGRRVLEGYFVAAFFLEPPTGGASMQPGVYLTPPPFQVSDGGCGVITVEYDIGAREFLTVACNGFA